MPNAKSKFAFQFTVNDMQSELYHWTFTFVEALDIKVAARNWKRFLGGYTRSGTLLGAFPTISGIRVFELHPGRDIGNGEILSHGLHVHAVVNERLPVEIVRSIAQRYGFGRVNVKCHPRERAMYLSKYLAKDRPECFKGMRLWAPFGLCDSHKVRDIVVDSRWTEAYKLLAATIGGFSKLAWNDRIAVVVCFIAGDSAHEALCRLGHFERETKDGPEHEGDSVRVMAT